MRIAAHPPPVSLLSLPRRMPAAIRTIFQQRGALWAAVELRRLFPGITDNAQARECARTIAGWTPLRPVKRIPKVPRLRRLR